MTIRSKNSLMSFMTGKETEKYNSRDPTLPVHEPSSASPSETTPKQHSAVRRELAAFLGEFIGTFMFLFLGFTGTQIALNAAGTQQLTSSDNPAPDVSKLIYIAFAFGVSLAINVAIFADISGGKFNPAVGSAEHFAHQLAPLDATAPSAVHTSRVITRCMNRANLSTQVTAALFLTGKITWHRAIQTIISQMIAGMAAAGFVSGLLPGPLIIATKLDPSISITRGLFLECFVTAQLVLTILMLKGGAAKPMYIGFSLFIAEICSVYFTGGSLNPARSFGPAVVVGFTGYHWIYWVGPLLGAVLASGAYALIKWVRQEQE